MPSSIDLDVVTLVCVYGLMAWTFWLPLATGQLSLASPAAICVGAYTAARLGSSVESLPLLVLAGTATGGLLGVSVSPLTLRLSGYSLALTTLGVSLGLPILIGSRDDFGGAFGLAGIPTSDLVLPIAAGLCVVLLVLSRAVFRGRGGRVIDVTGADELQAEALGISVRTTKVTALVLQGLVGGAAGALYASYVGYIEPSMFGIGLMIEIFAYVVVGGMATYLGPFFGAALLTIALDVMTIAGDSRQLLFGVLLLVLILVRRDGALGRSKRLQAHRVAALVRPSDPPPPKGTTA